MDSRRFDALTRTLAAAGTRRGVMSWLAALPLLGSPDTLLDVEARKKRRGKKKKKTCKGKKKCGKKCIPQSGCCSSGECGANGACVNNSCQCNSGFKACNGACIPTSACCPACTGNTVCAAGTCVCAAGFKACNGACIPNGDCCTNEDCPAGRVCSRGDCVCPSGEVVCGGVCCDLGPDDEVCKINEFGSKTCQPGGCPETDFCTDLDFYACGVVGDIQCACLTSVGGASLCSDLQVTQCDCTSDADCHAAMGADAYCIPLGTVPFCQGLGCEGNDVGFCARDGCPSRGPERSRHAGGGKSDDIRALTSRLASPRATRTEPATSRRLRPCIRRQIRPSATHSIREHRGFPRDVQPALAHL